MASVSEADQGRDFRQNTGGTGLYGQGPEQHCLPTGWPVRGGRAGGAR